LKKARKRFDSGGWGNEIVARGMWPKGGAGIRLGKDRRESP